MSLDLCLKQLHVVHIKVFLRMQYIRLLLFYSVIFQSCKFQSPVCLSVTLSTRISQKPRVQVSPSFLYMLSVAVARFSSDGNVMYYVFPVLWMTSRFHIMERWDRISSSGCCTGLPSPTACYLHVFGDATQRRAKSNQDNLFSP